MPREVSKAPARRSCEGWCRLRKAARRQKWRRSYASPEGIWGWPKRSTPVPWNRLLVAVRLRKREACCSTPQQVRAVRRQLTQKQWHRILKACCPRKWRGRLATSAGVWTARGQLTQHEWYRLLKFCRRKLGGTSFVTPQELLVHVLDGVYLAAAAGCGGSRWRKGVPFIAHLLKTIRQRARDSRESPYNRKRARGEQLPEGQVRDIARDIEDEEERNELMQRLREHIRGDAELEGILHGLETGMNASEIKRLLGLDDTAYATARRRLRRQLDKLGLRGGKS
jgi:hypothetical protein